MPSWFIATIAHSGAKMVQYLNGFHHRFAQYLGKDCIYVLVDRLKKISYLFFVTSSFSDAQVTDIFFQRNL